jgi:hypothetical protein
MNTSLVLPVYRPITRQLLIVVLMGLFFLAATDRKSVV